MHPNKPTPLRSRTHPHRSCKTQRDPSRRSQSSSAHPICAARRFRGESKAQQKAKWHSSKNRTGDFHNTSNTGTHPRPTSINKMTYARAHAQRTTTGTSGKTTVDLILEPKRRTTKQASPNMKASDTQQPPCKSPQDLSDTNVFKHPPHPPPTPPHSTDHGHTTSQPANVFKPPNMSNVPATPASLSLPLAKTRTLRYALWKKTIIDM